MTARRLLRLIALFLAGVATRHGSLAAPRQAAKDAASSHGDDHPFDSMDPFVAFSAISYVVFIDLPTLGSVRHELRDRRRLGHVLEDVKDGLTWTFTVELGKWSDGKPLTADDAAWTGNTILKFAKGRPPRWHRSSRTRRS